MPQLRRLQPLARICAGPLVLLLLAGGGCARDVTGGLGQEEPFPVQISMMMQLGADPSLSTLENWYYFVFNFGTLNPTEVTKPLDRIVGLDRGKNWEMYVAFHRNPQTQEVVAIWDRRDRAPSILRQDVAEGPVDAAVGSFNPSVDDASDILIAARDGNAVQLSLGGITDLQDDIFFDPPVTVNTGPQPLRVFSTSPAIGSFPASFSSLDSLRRIDLDGDGNQDAVVIFGGGGAGAFIRTLFSNGNGTFTAGPETSVPGIPVDAIFADFDTPGTADGTADLAILTVDTPGGAGTVRIFTGGAGGEFTAGPTVSAGSNPVQLAGGLIDAGNDIDLAVASAGSNEIRVFMGGDGASFAADAILQSPGELRGVSINTLFGSGGDVAFSYDEGRIGNVGVFLRESEGAFAETPVTQEIERPAGRLLTFDAGNDQRVDVLVLDPSTGTSDGNVVIMRTERVIPEGGGTPQFAWADFPIIYPTGNAPSRIVPVDFEGDNDLDLLVPNSGTGPNGKSVGIYVALGRYQYADINVYWTDGYDSPPQSLTLAPWYVSHSFAGNQISLTIDATQFLGLTELPPEELLRGQTSRNYFIVDMMTTDNEIDFVQDVNKNPDIGIVTEHFTQPIVVPMTIGYLNNNATTDVVNFPAATQERNITDWQIEAN